MTRRRILQAGDTGRAVCQDCATVVPVTYCYRDVPFREMPGSAKGILSGTCDHCGTVVLIPAQSSPHIRYWLEKTTPPVRLMVSRAEMEIFDAALAQIHRRLVPEGRGSALIYAFRQLSQDPALRERITNALPAFQAEISSILQRARVKNLKVPTQQLRLSLSPQQAIAIRDLAGTMGLTLSDLGRAAILVFREAEKDLSAEQLRKFRADVLAQRFERVG
ncbi:hypothetical protein [Falsigemmobacter faecalis]|uniref:hypothetical protein n=1 Tax=Falsigemmobacter faecalis TaxID=2488730 RepID=UPI0018F4A8F9|nr:hypothetical protein [Falsigemmobacter faecalis]